MKRCKLTSTMMTLVLALGLAGCGGDTGTEPVKPSVTVTTGAASINLGVSNLIVNGAATLDTVVSTYTSMNDAGSKDVIKVVADYMLFPTGDFETKNFAQRMGEVCLGEGNVGRIVACQAEFLSAAPDVGAGASRALVKNFPPQFAPIRDFIGNKLAKALPVVGAIFSGIFGGPSDEDIMKEKLEQIGKTLDVMRGEMRQGFTQVNQKLDTILDDLSGLRGDVNIIKAGLGAVINGDLQLAKDNFQGILDAYAASGNVTEASNIVYNGSVEYWQAVNSFISGANTQQDWLIVNGSYSNEQWRDPFAAARTNTGRIKLSLYQFTSPWNGYAEAYPNPKVDLGMSFGNVMYLAKMFTAWLQLNSAVYSGAELVAKNQALAAVILQKLEDSGIKGTIDGAVAKMRAVFNRQVAALETNWFKDLGPGGPDVWRLYLAYETTGGIAWSMDTYGTRPKADFDPSAKLKLEEVYRKELMNYLGLAMAQVLALEVQLRSYL